MNEYDITTARQWAKSRDWTVTVEATRILDRLRVWADENSDGWAHWPKPCRAAKQLQERIQEQERKANVDWPQVYDMTYNDRDKALRPIKAFLTRQGVSEADRSWILTGERYAAVSK